MVELRFSREKEAAGVECFQTDITFPSPGINIVFANMPVFQLNHSCYFPPPELAREDGLLAVGGDLAPARLLLAYRSGIFPWYSAGEPILLWSPDPRCVLFLEEFHLPARAGRLLRQERFSITLDTAFTQVIAGCAAHRPGKPPGTWITTEMAEAYCELHRLGHAHSVEYWHNGRLAGGLYGIALGGIFFGESMFSRVSGASKIALACLVTLLRRWGFTLIDCQVDNPHLVSLGARSIPGIRFRELLAAGLELPGRPGSWPLPAGAFDTLAANPANDY